MSYRDPLESLRARREHIQAQLAESRKAAREAEDHAKRAAALERELAEVDGMLQGGGWRRGLPLLEEVRVASPCSASWDDMAGDERVRFCGQCEKNVYNLSAMPREEAEAFLAERAGNVCVRLYRRADGTVVTADCPVGARRVRRRRVAYGAVASLLAAANAVIANRMAVHGGIEPHVDAHPKQLVSMMGAPPPMPMLGEMVVPGPQQALQGKPTPPHVSPSPPHVSPTMGRRAPPKAVPTADDLEPMMGYMK